MSGKGKNKVKLSKAGKKVVKAIQQNQKKVGKVSIQIEGNKRKPGKPKDGGKSGFQVSSAPTAVGTSISLSNRNGIRNADTRRLFPFQECIMPNVQTGATSQAGGLLLFGDNTGGAALQVCNIDLNPLDTITFGTRLTNEANNWEYFRFRSLRMLWVSTQSSNTPGQIVLAYDYDPSNPTPPANMEGYRYYTQLENATAISVWRDTSLNIMVGADKKYPVGKFYTDLNRAADLRQAVQGQLYVAHGSNLPASTKLGQVWIEGEVEFSERIYRPAAQACGIQGTGIVLPTGGAANQNTLALPGATYTAGNGGLAQVVTASDGAAAILLAPGTYLSDMSTFLAPSTSNSAGNLVLGTSTIFSSSGGLSAESPQVVPKRSDFSTILASGGAQSIAASKQEIVQVPYPGAYYRPLLGSPAYVGTSNPTTITINLSAVASSLLGFLTGLFAGPLVYANFVEKEMSVYFKAHGNMIGYNPKSLGEIKAILGEKDVFVLPPSDSDFIEFCSVFGLDSSLTSTQEKYGKYVRSCKEKTPEKRGSTNLQP